MAEYVLRVVGGPASVPERELDGPVEVGRSPTAGMPLVDDGLVSARHALLTPRDDGVLVEDLGSRNGTYLNGARVEGSAIARPGDVVTVGRTRIELVGLAVAEAAPPAPAPAERPTDETVALPAEPPESVAAPAAAPAAWALELVPGDGGAGRTFELTAAAEAGRDPEADIPLAHDDGVSWRHARLTPQADGVRVEDLGSRNGTYVDGERVDAPRVVPAGGRVQLGDSVLVARRAAAAEDAGLVVAVVDGPGAGREVPLAGALVIGRDPSAGLALVDDAQVSRRHTRLTPDGDRAVVEDLGSRNGTFVNGALVGEPTPLGDGDRVVVGSTVLELRRAGGRRGTGTVVRAGPRVAATELRPSGGASGEQPHPAEPVAAAAGGGGHGGWTFLVCALALFMAALDNLVVLFALPSIQEQLNASVQDLEWTVNAFTLAFAVFLLPAATLGDRFGRRRVFAGGIALFTLASAGCALAPSIEALLVARAVQGAGAAVVVPLSLTVLSAAFPAQKRGLVLGAWSGIAGLAIAVGPVVGGVIVTGLDWQWIFWINVPIGAAVAPLCFVVVRESFGAAARLDLVGIALSAVGLFGVAFGLVRASTEGWGSMQVLGPLLVGGALVAAFVAWQLRTRDPLLSMHLFRSRAFSAANVSSFCMYVGLFGGMFLLAQFLQIVQGYSALEAGLRSLPLTGMPIVVAPVAGALAERIGGRVLMVTGLAFEAVAFFWLAQVVEPGVAYGQLLGPFVLGGAGLGLFFAPVAHVVLGAVRLEEEGMASGANNAIRQVGGVVGVSVLTTVLTTAGSLASPVDFTDGLAAAFRVGAVVLLVGAAAATLIPRPRPEDEAVSMTSSLPAVGGFMPGASVVRPLVPPPPRAEAAPTVALP